MKREAMYLGEGESSFFGWYHAEESAAPADRVAVICGPIGHEHARAHLQRNVANPPRATEGIATAVGPA